MCSTGHTMSIRKNPMVTMLFINNRAMLCRLVDTTLCLSCRIHTFKAIDSLRRQLFKGRGCPAGLASCTISDKAGPDKGRGSDFRKEKGLFTDDIGHLMGRAHKRNFVKTGVPLYVCWVSPEHKTLGPWHTLRFFLFFFSRVTVTV